MKFWHLKQFLSVNNYEMKKRKTISDHLRTEKVKKNNYWIFF